MVLNCLIQLSYAIGISEPISIFIQTDPESRVNNEKLIEVIKRNFDLSPLGIKKFLQLDRPIYTPTAAYGHFGREYVATKNHFTWEKLGSVDLLGDDYS